MGNEFIQTILIASIIGIASGSIGSFIILRRMALVGDALSHVALPGIALALFYGLDPFWGVLSFLIAAAILIWWLEAKSKLPTDALVGLLFTASLAIGILTIPNTEILESLFGEFPILPPFLLGIVLTSAAGLTVLSFSLARKFLYRVISRDLAKVDGIERIYDLVLFLIFAGVIALGIKLLGALLMGALTIIPASIARNFARTMRGYMWLATILGGLLSAAGVIISQSFGFLPGPTIILLGIVLFLVSLIAVPRYASRS